MKLPASKEIIKQYPAEQASKYDRAALGWSIVFYLTVLLTAGGSLPISVFIVVGFLALIRNFNALHEAFHADERGQSLWRLGRFLPIVVAPWQLGYYELKNNHIYHHRFEGESGDPDRYLIKGTGAWTLLMAFTQPEQSVIRYLKRKGLDIRLACILTMNAVIWALLLLILPWHVFIIYTLVARFANAAVWWIFDYWLHHELAYRIPSAVRFNRVAELIWSGLFSQSNFQGVAHHKLHHKYPFVPDSKLRELERELSDFRSLS
ncbi:hypothetical protein NBRC116583_26480 [Arenicella sp. 4NH20-0111]|uniref:fatty acid desaturase n=1 Tax=Arenicella sp. 4NH20-0111 TaxID=3127648 RepID=UPI003106C91C